MTIEKVDQFGGVYVTGTKDLVVGDIVLNKDVSNGMYFVKNTSIEGIFTFGFKQKKEDYLGNPAGYIWSSRASVINTQFDTTLTECYYKKEGDYSYRCCALDLVTFEAALNNAGYEVDWEARKTTEDTDYRITKKEDRVHD